MTGPQRGRSDPDRDRADRAARDARVRQVQQAEQRARTQQRADAERQRERQQQFREGHTFREHVDVTDRELQRRAHDGTNARGHPGHIPADATRWQSDAAAVRAIDSLARTPEARQKLADGERKFSAGQGPQRFSVDRPLHEVLGPDWRRQVYGRSAASDGRSDTRFGPNSAARAVWQQNPRGQWHLLTCYPKSRT